MNFKVNKDVLIEAIKKWGQKVQTNKIQEEALELALVMNQMNCPTKDPNEYMDKFYDELADNVIMVNYYSLLFNEERIQEVINKKLDKLKIILTKDNLQ